MSKKLAQSYKNVAGYIDLGLRKYMLDVFSYMSAGLAITAIVAYFTSMSHEFVSFLYSSPLVFWVVALAPLGLSIYLTARISQITTQTASILFFAYAALLGVSLSSIFLIYSAFSIAYTFFVTSSMFLAMVVYGYTTGKDLTSMGSFMFMGLVGLIIASIINIFTKSHVFSMVISSIGVIIFTGLTAYDTQVIKSYYLDSDSSEVSSKKAIIGAMRLYLDFINLFMYLLRFIGARANNDR